ncbi:hypothetical protein ACTQ54_01420 [Fundicoccus sp. Sow4_H7]|uniref:hypothetical protein n=1 Tax=Fundicoccus sp. Sow4_H7 TaxID=3438784 RepID=UPI003F92E41D
MTEKSMVNYLISIDTQFQQVYDLINRLKSDIKQHSFQALENDLYETHKYSLPRKVRTTIQTFEK